MSKPRALLVVLGLLPTVHCALPYADSETPGTSSDSALSPPAPVPAANVTIDCSEDDDQVAHQVRYRRGWVQPIDYRDDVAAGVETAARIAPNVATGAFDLNGHGNASLFAYDAATDTLRPNASDPRFVDNLRPLKARGIPLFVQVSGTPYAARDWLETAYIPREGINGNFYPLPRPERTAAVQQAVIDQIRAVEATPDVGGNIWLGTQEPTHTLGFLEACASESTTPAERVPCRQANIRRFIDYWKPIATELRRAKIKVGGIQLNSHDRDLYTYAADALIESQTPIDYFAIQRYSSFETIVPEAYAAYERFQAAPGYRHVKVAFTRYSFDNNQDADSRRAFFASVDGMRQILDDERQIMEHAEMMYGYSYQTSGIFEPTSLVPTVMAWLQAAPAPLRSITFAPRSGLTGFALVARGGRAKAYAAVWNRGDAASDVVIVLGGAEAAFAGKTVTVLKGSGQAFTPVSAELRRGTVTGLTLAPKELALVAIQ